VIKINLKKNIVIACTVQQARVRGGALPDEAISLSNHGIASPQRTRTRLAM